MAADVSPRVQTSPFFVVGAQRSGTTLLRLMLDHHPELAVPHEFDYVIEALPAEGGWPAPAAFEAVLARSGSFRRSGLRLDRSLPFPEQAEDLLRQHQRGKPQVGMVVHADFERILRLWPQARFVHLVRDPRDVASSVIGMGWAGNVWRGVERWIEAEESWERLRGHIGASRFVELRYEDLIRDPERELRRLCAFLGADYAEAMLGYERDTTYRRPDPALAEQWRRRLSPRELRLVESRTAAWLATRGYAESGLPRLRVGRLRRAGLEVHDWLARMRSRVRRFGPALVAADLAARKLRIASWERKVQARIRALADRRVR